MWKENPPCLFLDQAGVASHALPLARIQDPGIGEASDMVVRLALVGALGVIDARHYGGIAKEVHFDFLDVEGGGLESRVSDVGEKFLLVAHFAVPLGVHKPARNQGLEGSR